MPPSLKRRLLTGGLWVLLGKVLTATCEAGSTVLLARLLTKPEFGAYGLAFTVATGGALLSQLGVHQAVVRFISEAMGRGLEARARAAVGQVYRLCIVGCVLFAALMLGGGGRFLALDIWRSPVLAGALVALTVWTVLRAIQILTSEVFRGFQDLFRATLFGGTISQFCAVLAFGAVWLIRGEADLPLVLGLAAAATAVSLVFGAIGVRRYLARLPAPADITGREVVAVAAPLWVSGLTGFALNQFDLWAVGAFLGPDEVAVYFAAARLVVLISVSMMLVNLVVPPFIGELYFKGETVRLQRVLRSAATFAGAPAFVVLVAFILFGRPILELLYTEPYGAGAPVLAILAGAKLINVLTGSCGITMGVTGHQRTLMWITIVTSVCAVVASLWAAPRHGVLGVAWSVAGARVAQNLAMWIATRRLTGMWTHVAIPRMSDFRELLSRG